jgi:sugar/nucleoside kinase (ribokinase family)
VKIAVAGTLLWDTIHPWRGLSREGPGGIAYNLLPLALLVEGGDKVVPVCWMGDTEFTQLEEDWKDFMPRLDLACVHHSPTGNDTNELRYLSLLERRETMTLRCPPLNRNMLKGVLDADLILFNAVTGREFSRDLVQRVASEARGLTMLDVHCLVCKLKARGHLARTRWPSWREWVRHFHIVQCNEEELGLMLGGTLCSLRELADGATTILREGPHCVIVTAAQRGSVVASVEGGRIRCWHTPALTPRSMQDPTGCGDCFSSGFICGYLRWGDPRAAVAVGTVVASANCETVALGAFRSASAAHRIRESVAAQADQLRAGQTLLV